MSARQLALGIFTGAVLAVVAPAPARAQVQITNVQLQQSGAGVQLILETVAGVGTPQIFTIQQGNNLVAEVLNAQLNLSGGAAFRQDNPLPGIGAVEVRQVNAETVRVTVMGISAPPVGRILQRDGGRLVLGFATGSNSVAGAARAQNPSDTPEPIQPSTPLPSLLEPSVPAIVNNRPSRPLPAPTSLEPAVPPISQNRPEVTPPPQNSTPQQLPTPETANQSETLQFDPRTLSQVPRSEVLVPNPEITIEGNPAPATPPLQPVSPAPPMLPRAVTPPVGDIAVANVDSSPEIIDLGTAERVARLTLRDAPIREVLSILARQARLNLIFSDSGGQTPGGAAPTGDAVGSGGAPTISLDLEDVPIQEVFNYVLQVSGLEAVRQGNTIFAGTKLPQVAKSIITRSFRLNQVEAPAAAAFLSAQGAETQRVVTVTTRTIEGEGVDRRVVEATNIEIRPLGAQEGQGPLLLKGLSVLTDERLNAVTLVGEPRKVQIATNFLRQLDARRRQVMVNVKVIDVNLNNIGRFGTSFSFGINNTGVVNESGIGIINFGTDAANIEQYSQDATTGRVTRVPNTPNGGEVTPSITGVTFEGLDQTVFPAINTGFSVVNAFLAQLRAAIQTNNAKILTDPSLVVQEGQTANVRLTQEVIGNIKVERDTTSSGITTTISTEKEDVGLQLLVNVQRIDDNGFITMAVNPEVTAVGNTQNINAGDDTNLVALISTRSLASGIIRIRDGQTLILTGIIRDQDRTNIQKIPILGDLPIIGSLFRRTTRTNERAEVIVMVTPQVMDDSQNSNFGYTYPPTENIPTQMLPPQGMPNGQ